MSSNGLIVIVGETDASNLLSRQLQLNIPVLTHPWSIKSETCMVRLVSILAVAVTCTDGVVEVVKVKVFWPDYEAEKAQLPEKSLFTLCSTGSVSASGFIFSLEKANSKAV
jgi:hypothetical protein